MEFAIIINHKIEFCSKEEDYSKFEIAIFSDMLIKELGEQGSWKLHKILFHDISLNKNLKLLTYVERPMIICLLGEMKSGSTYGYYLLEKIYEQIQKEFPIKEIEIHLNEKRKKFDAICNLLKLTIFGNLGKKTFDNSSSHEEFKNINQLIYAGISSSGLPIISKLYENQDFLKIKDGNKKEILSTILSGQLATISINSFIRAGAYIRSIQIKTQDLENQDSYLFFDFREFGKDNNFILETLYAGDPSHVKEKVDKIKKIMEDTTLFNEEFGGKLQKYNSIKTIFSNLDEKFD